MSYQAVILNLNTLIDPLYDIADCMNQALNLRGLKKLPKKSYAPLLGLDFRSMAGAVAQSDEEGVYNDFIREYSIFLTNETSAYQEMYDFLNKCEQSRIDYYVRTSYEEVFARRLVDHFFPKRDFKELNEFDLDLKTLVGGFSYDRAFALEKGFDLVGTCWGHESERELRGAGVVKVAKTPQALIDILIS
jgi:phosphoglycolate phosphatase-like HAD superfamily hydrolase